MLPGYQTSGLLLECYVVRKLSYDIVSADFGLINGFSLVAPVEDIAEYREGI